MQVVTSYYEISPEDAIKFLEYNISNRPIRPTHVNYLTRCILNGEFQTTHQGIAFDECGNLIDGQHRLYAIVKAGKSVVMSVTTGLKTESFKVLDNGIKRTVSDLSNIPTSLVNCASFVLYNLESRGRAKPTVKEIEDVFNTELGRNIKYVFDLCKKNTKYFSSAPARVAASCAITIGSDISFVTKQFKALTSLDYDNMNNVSKSLARLDAQGKVRAGDQLETFYRNYQCFSEQFKNNTTNKYSIENSPSNARSVLTKSFNK